MSRAAPMDNHEGRADDVYEMQIGAAGPPHHHLASNETLSLPPVDGGRSAWLVLVTAFLTEMFLWGFPFSFGVLQSYYKTHLPISKSPGSISAVGTTCTGIMYLAAPVMTALMQQGPFFRRYCTFFGLALVVLAV